MATPNPLMVAIQFQSSMFIDLSGITKQILFHGLLIYVPCLIMNALLSALDPWGLNVYSSKMNQVRLYVFMWIG